MKIIIGCYSANKMLRQYQGSDLDLKVYMAESVFVSTTTIMIVQYPEHAHALPT